MPKMSKRYSYIERAVILGRCVKAMFCLFNFITVQRKRRIHLNCEPSRKIRNGYFDSDKK